jgi:diaminopimelate decarboxylase
MRAHEAGALHGNLGTRGPDWLQTPRDINALLAPLWPKTVNRASDGALRVGGIDVRDLAVQFATPAYVFDEADFRERCRDFREAFAGADIFYAAKAFCAKAVLRIVVDEGLNLDVCTGGELAVALAAGVPPERIKVHGNNKSVAELRRALRSGVGWIVVDSFDEIARLTSLAQELAVRPKVMVRVTVGVEAHTHEFIATAHEDQKFGFSLGSGRAFDAAAQIMREDVLELVGLHSHIGSQIFDTSGFEVSARRVLTLQDQLRVEFGDELPELDLGGGFGIAYTSQDDPATPADLAARMVKIVEQECAARSLAIPHLSIEPGRALVGPAMFTLYEVGTVKDVDGIRT